MKLIFFLLLGLNIGFFIYNFNKEPQKLSNISYGEQNIVLYSESTKDHSYAKLVEKEPNIEKQETNKLVDKTETQTIISPNRDDEVIEQLFSEVDSQSKSIIKNQTEQQKNYEQKEFNCFVLGPTLHPQKLQVLKSKIRDQYGAVFFSILEQKGTKYYRIYIPPLKDLSEIKKAKKILSENNLDDHYVMNQEGKRNAIALGVFRIKKITDDIANKVKRLGYQAVIEPILEADKIQFFLKIHTSKQYPIINLDQQKLGTDLEIESCKKN